MAGADQANDAVVNGLRSHEGGATSIEYGLMAAVLGVGVLFSAHYIKTELGNMIAGHSCVWEEPEEGDENSEHRCVESPGWNLFKR